MNATDLTAAERDELARIGALADHEIDVLDIPEASAESWKHAFRGIVRVDGEVLAWFRQNAGKDYAAEINRVLRRHVERTQPSRQI